MKKRIERRKPVTAELRPEIEPYPGKVPKLIQKVVRSQTAMELLQQQAKALSHLQLTPRYREAIALRVAELNRCEDALTRHTVLGRRAGMNDEEMLRCRRGISNDLQEQALLALVTKIFKDHGHNARFVLDLAREVGLSDGQIIEVITLVGCHNLTQTISSLAAGMIELEKE